MEFVDADELSKTLSDEQMVLRVSKEKGRYMEASKVIPAGNCVCTEKAAFSIDNELKQHLIVELKLPEMSVSRIFVGAMYDFIDLDKRLAALCYSKECLCPEELEMMETLEEKNPGLLKRYLMLVHNSFEVVNPPAAGEQESPLATKSAVYFKASFFNHSCNPNCSYTFDIESGNISIVTKKDIAPGDELTICYCLIPEPDEDEDEDEVQIRNQVSNTSITSITTGADGANMAGLFRRKYGFACKCANCILVATDNENI